MKHHEVVVMKGMQSFKQSLISPWEEPVANKNRFQS